MERFEERADLAARHRLVQPHAPRHEQELSGASGKARRLPVLPELQAVLQIAQEHVSLAQFGVLLVGDEPLVRDPVQRQERVPMAQPGVPAAVLELQRLNAELQLADSPPAQLDVALRAPRRAEPGVNPVLHGADLEDHVGIGGRRINQRLHALHEAAPQGEVAGGGPRFDQRLALPRLGPVPVVGNRGSERDGDFTVAAPGTQAEIDAEHLPLGPPSGDEARDLRGQPREELLVGDRGGPRQVGAGGFAVAREQVKEIDVAAVVQLLSSQLPQRHDREGRLLGVALVIPAGGPSEAGLQAGARHPHRLVDQNVGQQGQRPRHGGQIGMAQKIGEGDAQELALLEAPQDEGGIMRGVQMDEARQVLLEVLARRGSGHGSPRGEGFQEFRVLDQD